MDLGIVRVESRGAHDTVYLAHNNLKAFTALGRPGANLRLTIRGAFLHYSNEQWAEVLAAYLKWKRPALAGKMPRHSGRTRDGSNHPWRNMPASRKRRPLTEPCGDLAVYGDAPIMEDQDW